MNPVFTLIDLRRHVRDVATLSFTILLPGALYLVFGSAQPASDEPVGSGNVATYVMIPMALYGAVVATMTVGGSVALERFQGWGRQLALTPLRPVQIIGMKAAVAVLLATLPVAFVFLLGAVTGAQAPPRVWALSALACWGGSIVFAFFGLAVGLAFRTEAALGAAGGSLVVLGFFGNMFVPLSGVMLEIGRFTPMYGIAALARWPLTDGFLTNGQQDPLWLPLVNVGVWSFVFAAAAVALFRWSAAAR